MFLKIKVVSGVGTGKTTLSAFDNALKKAGVYNYNLIRLSSIIPPKSQVTKAKKYESPQDEYGHKLYVIKAEIRSKRVGNHIASGIGWYQLEDNRGMFVEHEIEAETEVAVQSEIKSLINDSISDLCRFRGIKYKPSKVKSKIVYSPVKNKPTCVLVLAVYRSQSWEE
ncbi:MAG TPA: pyruvoyl-dependent arginine decarboxylase [Patescibacteria group bacterium]|nr:pyruvoyl-dependent arginine decarboxylase [Patescibacteria group bacterium]